MVAPLRCTAACKYPHERYVRGGCPSRVDERRSLAVPSVTPDCSCCRAALTLLDLYYIHLDGGAGSKWMSNNAMRGGYLLRSPWQIAPNGNGTRNPMPIDGQATSTRGGRTLPGPGATRPHRALLLSSCCMLDVRGGVAVDVESRRRTCLTDY